jgi:serine/threonine protein kinase
MSPENWRLVDRTYNEVLEKPPEERRGVLASAGANLPSDVLAKVEELLWSPEEDDYTLFNALDARLTAPPGNHRPGGIEDVHSPIPRWLRDLADQHEYEIRKRLKGGGQGWVYLAYDRRHNEMVALKTMRYIDATCLMLFYREFDDTKDVRHRNLLRLYNLISNGHDWFFTMEWVNGRPFLAYIRSGGNEIAPPEAALLSPPSPRAPATESGSRPLRELSPAELNRLRHAVYQLAQGIHYLHQADLIHCDIKDSNVLVTADGKVKILDYGLIRRANDQGIGQHIRGTFEYMAPEQAERGCAYPASDWYSVGVMLYHALTGRMPFHGDAQRVLFHDKQIKEPVPPCELVPSIPADLNALCVDLLRRLPQDRPSGEEILRRLGKLPEPPPLLPPFVGRVAALNQLREAYLAVRNRRTVQVLIHGSSGIGKSALLNHFLDEIGKTGEAVVLAGRCNERVVAPYEALRNIVDALTRYLQKPGVAARVGELLPRDLRSLLSLFPVLETVPAVARWPRGPEEATDPQELRRRAFAAFRELLQRLGDRHTVVLVLDDLQWADLDSAALLNSLLRPPESPRLLLLGCYRSEDAASSPFLTEFLNPSDQRMVRLEALAQPEARELARELRRRRGAIDSNLADWSAACAEVAEGIPVFVEMIAQHAPSDGNVPRFEDVVAARVRQLPEAARGLLETVAVAARPLLIEEWYGAAGLPGEDGHAPEELLYDERFIRNSGSARIPRIEIYHDRIRQTILAGLASEKVRQHHWHLALVLRKGHTDGTEAEVLAYHLEGAGEMAEASRNYGVAADGAARGLAFDRAADLYRRALGLLPDDVAERRRLYEQLGAALANAGRGKEAGDAFLNGAEGADVGKNRDLRRRAAEQFLRSGHVVKGLEVLDDVLREVGLRLPRTPRKARRSWLLRCARLRDRGLRFCLREERDIPPDQLQRVDLCRSAAVGLLMVDPIRGADFQARNVLLALRAGERERIALALANQAMMCAFFGGGGRRYVHKLLGKAQDLIHPDLDPLAWANVLLCRGGVALAEEQPLTATKICDDAERLLRNRCTGIAWELCTAQIFSLSARRQLGQHLQHDQLHKLLDDAQDRGDLFAATHVRMRSSYAVYLNLDQPDQALQELRQAMEGWPPVEESRQHGFHLQHYWFLVGRIDIALYRGNGSEARRLVTQHESALRRSLLLKAPILLRDWLYVRARSALAAAVASGPGNPQDARALLREAEGDARRLERIKGPTARGMGKLVRAGVAAAEGRTGAALRLLTKAERVFDAAGTKTFLAVARCRRAKLCGSETLYDETIASMIELKIQNPFAMLTMFAPGFESSSSVGT